MIERGGKVENKQQYLDAFRKETQAKDSTRLLKDFRVTVVRKAIKNYKFNLDSKLQFEVAIMERELEKRLGGQE